MKKAPFLLVAIVAITLVPTLREGLLGAVYEIDFLWGIIIMLTISIPIFIFLYKYGEKINAFVEK